LKIPKLVIRSRKSKERQIKWPNIQNITQKTKDRATRTQLKIDNEQINSQNIDNSECFGVKFVKIYPEIWFWLIK
jgi:hypothetical protein